MNLLDRAKHAVFEDEGPAETKAKPEPTPAVAYAIPAVAPSYSTATTNSDVYQSICAGSQFEDTESGKVLNKFLGPLAAISDTVMPPAIKVKSAMALAGVSLTPQAVLMEFDNLEVELRGMENTFKSQSEEFSKSEIDDKQKQLVETTQTVARLQMEIAQATQRLQQNTVEFNAAMQRRRMELGNQKSQYETYLKG